MIIFNGDFSRGGYHRAGPPRDEDPYGEVLWKPRTGRTETQCVKTLWRQQSLICFVSWALINFKILDQEGSQGPSSPGPSFKYSNINPVVILRN